MTMDIITEKKTTTKSKKKKNTKTQKSSPPANQWTIEDSLKLYSIDRWGQNYFSINDKGHLCLLPSQHLDGPCVDIAEVIEEIQHQGIQFPVVIRFHDILRAQVTNLNKTFNKTIEEAKFGGSYFGVFPIKVNQMREVVEEVLDAGHVYNYGLEVGSKTEMLVALAYNTNNLSLTILNGHKDRDYLALALLGIKLGRKVIVVIEKFSELKELIELSKEMKVTPMIGIRARMESTGSGKWAESAGAHAKFGLTIAEMLHAVDLLKEEEMTDSLTLFHFHIGSQITDIRKVKGAITEGARIYAKMRKMGLNIKYFDVGGGVGVDYDGTRSTNDSSMNYTLKDYAEDVVYILKQVCDLEDVDHPHIVSETGRAIAAYHACVITNVFGSTGSAMVEYNDKKTTGEHILVGNMRELLQDLTLNNCQETYNDAQQKKEEMIQAFNLGIIDLTERAKVETLYWKIMQQIHSIAQKEEQQMPEEIMELESVLSKQYLCNFSIFQSTPDSWAIGQLLPIVPIQGLEREPTEVCSLADITCDSDGKIDQFIGHSGMKKTIPLHKIQENNSETPYHIGIFLTGAYQDIMGDIHNLYGRLTEVHVYCDDEDPSDFYIEEVIEGNTAQDILASLQYGPSDMSYKVKKSIEKHIQRGKIRPREGVKLSDFYEKCMKKYTYLDKN